MYERICMAYLVKLMIFASLSSLEGEWHELESKRERAKKRRRVEGALGSESFGTHQ